MAAVDISVEKFQVVDTALTFERKQVEFSIREFFVMLIHVIAAWCNKLFVDDELRNVVGVVSLLTRRMQVNIGLMFYFCVL